MDGSGNRTDTHNKTSAAGVGPSWLKYPLTVVLCAAAMLITVALPGARSNPVFLLLMIAVAVAAWFGGWSCAVLATLLALFAEFYLVYPSARGKIASPVLITRFTAMVVLMVGTGIVFALLRASANRKHDLLAKEQLARATADVAMAHQRGVQEVLQRYELIAREGRDIVLFMRHDNGRILEANQAAELAYGYTREELLDLTIQQLRAPETRNLTVTQMQEASTAGLLFETVHVRKDGSRFPVEVNSRGAEIAGVRTLISIVRDITVRREAQDALRRQMATFQAILDATRESIWLFETDGTVVLGNETALRRMNLPPEVVIGGSIQEFLPPELAASRYASLQRVMETGQSVEAEDERAGMVFQNHYYPITDSHGRVTRIAAFSRDITEHRRAQAAEAETGERLRRVLSSITDGYYAVDSEWRFVAANHLAEKHFGLPAQELIGRNLWELAGTPEDNPIHRTFYAAALAGKPQTFETTSLLHPGTWSEVHLCPMPNGLEVYFRDITERKRAELALRESEERFRNVFENAPIGIAVTNQQGGVTQINAAFLAMLGYERAEELPVNFIDLVHEDERAANRAAVERLWSGAISSFTLENRYLRRNGESLWVRKFVSMLRDDAGRRLSTVALVTDMTEAREAERALRESEQRFRLALQNAPVSVAIQDRDLIYRWAYNQRSRRPEEVVGKTDADLFAAEELPAILVAKRRVLESGSEVRVQQWVTSNRQRFFLDLYCEPTRDDAGNVNGIGIAAVDLTDYKLAEEALRESEERLSMVLKSAALGTWDWDLASNALVWSARCRELFGVGTDVEITYQVFREALHPDDRERIDHDLRVAVEHHRDYDTEMRALWPDGNFHWVSARGRAYYDDSGQPLHMSGVAQDITARKFAEEQRRLSEEKLAKAFAINPAAIVISRLADGAILDVNEASLAMFGTRREGVLGTSFVRFWPDEVEREAVLKELLEKGVVYNREVTLLRNSGEPFVALGSAALLRLGAEDLMLSSCLDITEHKQAEQALLRSEKLASVGRMAATVAHEINNPLASVMNLIYLATNAPDLPETVRMSLEMADTELRRVAHIARQSLGFYRETAAPSVTSLNRVLESTVDLLQGKIRQRRALIEKQWPGEVQLRAVAGELRQVFSNLIANSLDAIDDCGTIKLRLTTFQNEGSGRRWVRVTVADSGHGIHPRDVRHLFEPFFTTKGALGTGLGLWVSRQIIDKHGGSIRVHSRTEGSRRGTSVSVVLPLEAAVVAPTNG